METFYKIPTQDWVALLKIGRDLHQLEIMWLNWYYAEDNILFANIHLQWSSKIIMIFYGFMAIFISPFNSKLNIRKISFLYTEYNYLSFNLKSLDFCYMSLAGTIDAPQLMMGLHHDKPIVNWKDPESKLKTYQTS